MPYTQRVPAGRSSCPVATSVSSSRPTMPGASHRLASRDQSQTQAASVLSGIVRARVALRPPPRPDVGDLQLSRDLTDGQRLPLRDVEPARAGLEALAPSRPRSRLEPDHDPDPRRRDADREELRNGLAVAHAEPARSVDRTVAPDEVRVCVVLEHEVGDGPDRPPPRRGVPARERLARDEERRPSTALRQPGDEAQDVGPIALGARSEGRRERRAPHLVQRDERRLASRHGDRVVEERVGALLHQRRIGRVGRRADPLAEVHVPVHRPGTRCARLLRDPLPPGRNDDARPCEAVTPERHRAVGEVDPRRSGSRAGRTRVPSRLAPATRERRRERRRALRKPCTSAQR